MATNPQVRTGYIRGVRGMVITALNADGLPVTPAVSHGMRTAQQVGVSVVNEGGEAAVLRGGDRLLIRIKEPDTIVGIGLAVQDARFDARAIQLVAGGTLILEATTNAIIGWDAPTIAAQQSPPYFRAEVFALNHTATGGADGWVRYTFKYCRATFGNETLQDQNWVIPEMNIECLENPQPGSGGIYRKEFVAALPAELA